MTVTAGSLVGLGGGFVLIPLLTKFGRFSQHMASGTSLAVVVATGLAGTSASRYLHLHDGGAMSTLQSRQAIVHVTTSSVLMMCVPCRVSLFALH